MFTKRGQECTIVVDMPAKRHEELVEILSLEKSLSKRGFAKTLRAALSEFNDVTDIRDTFRHCAVIPDAFLIDSTEKLAICYEVEVGGPISRNKIDNYAELLFDIDHFGWWLKLIRVLHTKEEQEIDLRRAWYDLHHGRHNSACTFEEIASSLGWLDENEFGLSWEDQNRLANLHVQHVHDSLKKGATK